MNFKSRLLDIQGGPLRPLEIAALQVNLGYCCNMFCGHCHVEAGPHRKEMMDLKTVTSVLEVLHGSRISALDITGGSPEMNPHFMHLVKGAKDIGCHVLLRTNLTIFFEGGMDFLPGFLNSQGVEVVASLPCYTEDNVDRVRGKGAFKKSIRALQMLNSLGYGRALTGRRLNLVYNPAGAFVSPSQKILEDDYRRELGRRFGISFDSLYAFTNMPIGRFKDYLIRTNHLEKYMAKLADSFNPETMQGLMCRHIISVGWDGRLYDCDFNQLLSLAVDDDCPRTIMEFDIDRIMDRTITVGNHCYACTAAQGST
ncbi:MAG: arsenosugar biosynthesis radical SAM protein ArsS [Nitrospirae bacterium]|nr:arsenosugar biosynthesis radical SAM protein ArsS [Nitrospirota bacterium]